MVDYSLASGTGLLNIHKLQWEPQALQLAGIAEDRLSTLCSPTTVHRGLDPLFASRTGLQEDVPVVVGSSDAANSSLGAGAVLPGQAACMLGTSGALRVFAPSPVPDSKARTWCYAVDETHWLVGGAINNGGVALSWFKDILNQGFRHLPSEDLLSFEDVLNLAAKAGAGAGGLICLPFFAGERSPNWNANARAAFFGMTLDHNAVHLSRALLEGIAFRLRSVDETLAEAGCHIGHIIASGGFVKSEFWLQLVSDVLNRKLTVPKWGETSSLGAAFWAILSVGGNESLESLAAAAEMDRSLSPDPGNVSVYSRLYSLYRKLYRCASALFDEIAETNI